MDWAMESRWQACRKVPAVYSAAPYTALSRRRPPAREPVRAVGQQPPQLLPGPHPLAQPADAEELVRRVQPLHGRCWLPPRE
jgi:hypothetical protein